MAKRILVPLDGTMVAHMALPHAVALARATSSKLILLYVTPPPANSHALSLSRATRATAMHGHHRDNGDHREGLALLHRYLEATARTYTGRRLAYTNGNTRRRPRTSESPQGRERSHNLDHRHGDPRHGHHSILQW